MRRRVKLHGREYRVEDAPSGELKVALDAELYDPTEDKQVSASGDDGERWGASDFSATNTTARIGAYVTAVRNIFVRFLDLTLAGTIDTAYIELYAHLNGNGSPLMKVYGVDEDNPAAPTTAAEYDADVLTSASVDWDEAFVSGSWEQSPELKTIFQELVDSYTISGDAVMLFVKDDGSGSAERNEIRLYDYTGNTYGPKLHVEYTVTVAAARSMGLIIG